ncbi:MAG: alpha-glucosidase/alpha-galactosidase [Verrucomicrobiota bacterium]
MAKITFMGAGSTIFAKNVLGDAMRSKALCDAHIALYDIDAKRLEESRMMLGALNANINKGRATITAHLGVRARKAALRGADYVVNAINVGGYKPCTVTDFEIPKKHGIRQTVADTIGIGGIFRALRTAPVMLDFAREMEQVCPDAWFLNYANPMAMLTGVLLKGTSIKTVGLCHSVQYCVPELLENLGMKAEKPRYKIAGINHMAWLLDLHDGKKDIYPEVKKRAAKIMRDSRKNGAKKNYDMVRFEMMRHFGCYITESPVHSAEYYPYWIKSRFPELVDEFNIPLDHYLGVCEQQIADWEKQRDKLVHNKKLSHRRSIEFASYIMEAMETDVPTRIHGNIVNNGLISNLPDSAIVEIPCLVDRNGIQGCHVGALPEQLAALNRTHINVHLLMIDAILERSLEKLYHAALLEPRLTAELPIDKIKALVDDMIIAHGKWLPTLK